MWNVDKLAWGNLITHIGVVVGHEKVLETLACACKGLVKAVGFVSTKATLWRKESTTRHGHSDKVTKP